MANDDGSSQKEPAEDVPRDLLARRQYVLNATPLSEILGADEALQIMALGLTRWRTCLCLVSILWSHRLLSDTNSLQQPPAGSRVMVLLHDEITALWAWEALALVSTLMRKFRVLVSNKQVQNAATSDTRCANSCLCPTNHLTPLILPTSPLTLRNQISKVSSKIAKSRAFELWRTKWTENQKASATLSSAHLMV